MLSHYNIGDLSVIDLFCMCTLWEPIVHSMPVVDLLVHCVQVVSHTDVSIMEQKLPSLVPGIIQVRVHLGHIV